MDQADPAGDSMLGVANPQQLVLKLREEAEHLRDCFTQFSFKTISFSAGGLALMFAGYDKLPVVDFAAIPIIALLFTVARIGIYKYSASTRHFGYELHLARTQGEDHGPGGWRPYMRRIDWEEALRAWRIVQPALFRKVYRVPERYPGGRLGKAIRRFRVLRWLNDKDPRQYKLSEDAKALVAGFNPAEQQAEYPWFMPQELSRSSQGERLYHAGSYLKNMFQIILLIQLLVLIPMTVAIYEDRTSLLFYTRVATLAFLLLLIAVGTTKLARRRRILEHELLSIHSNAITWQAVILAHFRATEKGKEIPGNHYKHYTQALVRQAEDLERHVFRIHEWVAGK